MRPQGRQSPLGSRHGICKTMHVRKGMPADGPEKHVGNRLMHIQVSRLVPIASLLALSSAAAAQTGVAWVQFAEQPAALGAGAAAVSDVNTDVDFAVGDLDQDGWLDVVVARKQQGGLSTKHTNVLLMNLQGVLTDQTAAYASASDVPGDLSFLTPCVHTAVKLADINLDGWLDVIFSTTLSDADPKVISHPRVYRNLGNDAAGGWQGLKFENGRIPQLKTVGGLSVAPRFSQFDVADVTGDGAPDLYFVDHDGTETGIPEVSSWDLNDRLLVNDGNGYFFDASFGALTVAQLNSAYGLNAQLIDLNADGAKDIVKLSFLGVPQGLFAIYNNPASLGSFAAGGLQTIGKFPAIDGFKVGDLNNDAFVDLAISDCTSDGFQLSTGYDALNHLVTGPKVLFQYVSGADDGFGQNVVLSDLDL